MTSLAPLGIGQSTRGYEPMRISHYKANWIGGSDKWEEPTWPLKLKEGDVVDKERLRRERIDPSCGEMHVDTASHGVHGAVQPSSSISGR